MDQQLTHGFKMLDVHVNMMGNPGVLHPTLIVDGEQVILVDCGLPGQVNAIREAMQQQTGVDFERITQIIVTHHDLDHIGGLREILAALPGHVRVLAHTEEIAYINGQKRPLKLAKMEDNLDTLPEERKPFYNMLKTAFGNAITPVDEALSTGQELPYCGGIIVVFTPGHTLGHISLYFKASKTLIAGDALAAPNGVLNLPPEQNNHDMALCRQSMQTLAGYDIETVICYHGGLYRGEANQRIVALAGAG